MQDCNYVELRVQPAYFLGKFYLKICDNDDDNQDNDNYDDGDDDDNVDINDNDGDNSLMRKTERIDNS